MFVLPQSYLPIAGETEGVGGGSPTPKTDANQTKKQTSDIIVLAPILPTIGGED